MSEIPAQLAELGKSIEQFAGSEARIEVMRGSEGIGESTEPEAVAQWTAAAMQRLDNAVDEERRIRIMQRCGYACSARNGKSLMEGRERRLNCATEQEFLEAEVKDPLFGTRLERQGNRLVQHYTPRSYSPPMRCYCSLLWKLPEARRLSQTYCQCSRAFVERYWEGVLGRPVQVRLLATALQGAEECSFEISLGQ